MTEKQIHDGFERLQGALAPPADTADRVQHEIGVRRRRRRTALAGVGVLVVAGTVGGAVLLGSGGDPDGSKAVATDTSDEQGGSFTLTRGDGSTITVDDLTLSCDRQPDSEGAAEPGHIYLYSPFELDETGEALTKPFLYFDGTIDKIRDMDFALPQGTGSSSDDGAFVLFAADSEIATGADRPNEVNSAEGATGTMRVLRASCDPTPVLELEVDASLRSEVQQDPWTVKGSFRQS